MSIAVLDHTFINHKSVEMICWGCGYVIWRCKDADEVESAMTQIDGQKSRCGKSWGRTIPVT